ncbi:MAG: DUF362 domain-containing protein [Polyangiaceae bacterium]
MVDHHRRDVLKRLGTAAAVLGGSAALGRATWDQGGLEAYRSQLTVQTRDFRLRDHAAHPVDLAIARRGDSPAERTRAAIDGMGGMARFIKRGDLVAIKPNIGWDRGPLHAANTNPVVVATLVTLALEAGAKRVVVTDASCNDATRCFQRSGIWKSAYDAGAEVILPAAHRFRPLRLGGVVLDEWPIYRPLVAVDKIINVPVAKHHNLARFTAAMKNWYGLLGGRRNRLHQNIDRSIADLATFMQPTLTVVDATRVLMRNGPQGGNIADTKELNTIIASIDQVAIDAYCTQLIGVQASDVPYLHMGQERGLGTMDWRSLRRVEV